MKYLIQQQLEGYWETVGKLQPKIIRRTYNRRFFWKKWQSIDYELEELGPIKVEAAVRAECFLGRGNNVRILEADEGYKTEIWRNGRWVENIS